MGSNVGFRTVLILSMAIGWSALCANPAASQEKTATGAENSGQSGGDLRTLAEVIRQLQTQVQKMNAELRKLREEQQNARAETTGGSEQSFCNLSDCTGPERKSC